MSPTEEAPPVVDEEPVDEKPPSEKRLAIRNCNKASRRVRLRFLRSLTIFLLSWFVAELHLGSAVMALVLIFMIPSFFFTIWFFLRFFHLRLRWVHLRKQPDSPVQPEPDAASA
jgi:hypothetical protein